MEVLQIGLVTELIFGLIFGIKLTHRPSYVLKLSHKPVYIGDIS